MSLSLKFYIAIITIISGALVCALLFFHEPIDPWWIVIIWGLSGWFADAYPVEVRKIDGNRWVIGLGMTFNLSAAVLFSPLSAMIIGIITATSLNEMKTTQWYKIVFNVAQISIATFVVAFTYRLFPVNSEIVKIFAIAAVIGVYAIINNTFVAGAVSLATKKRFGGILKDVLIDFFGLSIFISLSISYLAIYLYPYVHFYVIFVILGPLLAIRFVIDLYRKFLNTKLETMYALTRALEEKDPYTAGHGERVSLYCEVIAEKIGIYGKHLDDLKIAAQLHDIGKIGVRDIVLNKPTRLTDAEYDEIKRHPVDGAKIISEIPSLDRIVPWVRYHHERWNGTGYPDGKKGTNTPLEARIIGICDVYDALTTKRSYRDEFTHEEAIQMIASGSGKDFDPELVSALIESEGRFNKIRVAKAPLYMSEK
ncbi:MAG: HD-GYP domain-containing protein [Thermotogae bacterium]|nr:HD-GYP domain-containing protein [Thermotogota bacterium]